jgi:hypothetical protein
MTSEQALQRVENLGNRNANALSLAQLLSFAALAEPALIRKVRLELLPNSSAADEADLWFSNLVQSRSPDGLVFYPEVAEVLRSGLSRGLRDEAWHWTKKTHGSTPRAIQIEEELTYLALDPQNNQQQIDNLLADVISAMIGGRNELANWAGRALPRLPSAIQSRETATALKIAADFRLGRSPDLRGALAPFPRMPAWVELVLPRLRRVRVGVNLANRELTLGPVVSDPNQSLPHSIEVPDTPTVAVEARWTARDGTQSSKILFVEKDGMSQSEPVDGGLIELITLANETWTLEPTATQTGLGQLTPPAIAASTDGYAVTLHWRMRDPIPGCLGFALIRRRRGKGSAPEAQEVLSSRLGFGPSVESEPSTKNPVQRFSWIDRPPLRDTEYSYRVMPVVGNPGLLQILEQLASTWTPWIRVGAQVDAAISVTFNRTLENAGSLGLTPEALGDLSRRGLQEVIAQPGHPVRDALGGDLLSSLNQLLTRAQLWSYTVYLAMFELSDPEMIAFLENLEHRANVVLSNGVATSRQRDSNREARQRLRRSGVQILDRLFPSGKLAHNKFMVICDPDGKPSTVWLGNVSWTSAAFCAKANAAIIVNSRELANVYFDYWSQLAESGDRRSKPHSPLATVFVGETKLQPWLTPAPNLADLNAAERLIQDARQGILFLLSEPGEKGSLLQPILSQQNIFLQGVTRHGPTMRLYHNSKETLAPKLGSALPLMQSLERSVRSAPVPVQAALQSRMIVIDPLGGHPVVMIGSHNFGVRGSKQNEESFLIIENDREVARRCAAHIDAYYRHYSFRMSFSASTKSLRLGIQSDDKWQRQYFEQDAQSEMSFWLGEEGRTFEPAPEPQMAATPKAPRKKAAPQPATTKKAAKPAATKKTARKALAKRAATSRTNKTSRVSKRVRPKKKKK